jgi:hypothetical protein
MTLDDVSKVSDLIRSVDDILKKLAPYKPDVKKLQIDYVERSSVLRLGIEVPNGLKRKIRDIEIPAYGGYTINEILDESFNVVKVVPRIESGKWLIDASKLPASERYLIAMSGKVSEQTIQNLIRLDVPEDPIKEPDSDKYWVHSAIKDLSFIEKMYSELNIDKVLATVKVGVQRTFSSSVPPEIVEYLEARAVASDALSGTDRQRLFKEWQSYRSAKRRIGNLPTHEVFDLMMKLLTPDVFKVYVSINKPFRLHSVIPLENGARIPDKIGVNVQTDLNYKTPAADGDLVFNKRDFSDNVKKEFNRIMGRRSDESET